MEQIHTFEKERQISFSNRKALIQFVSKYFAFLYKEHCEHGRATAMDETEERKFFEERIKKEVAAFEKATKELLDSKRYFRRRLKFTSKSIFFKEVFKTAKISSSSKNYIPCDVEYEINNLVFKKYVSIRPN